jgi:hypothetical protein
MRYRGRIGLAVMAVAMGALVLGSSLASASTAGLTAVHNGPVKHSSTVAGCGGKVAVYYAVGWYNNSSAYGCTLKGIDWMGNALPRNGWALPIYEVVCYISACNSIITITDQGWVGDFYALWVTDNSTLLKDWAKVGSTPEVKTGSPLTAPTYNAHWTGKGTKYSSMSFVVYDPKGVTEYFAVQDVLMGLMGGSLDSPCGVTTPTLLSGGCTATGISVSAGWSPAGYSIDFAAYP